MALATAEGAAERATRGATQASAATRAQRALEAAAMRELVLADKAYERSQIQAAKAAAAAAAQLDAQIITAQRGHANLNGVMIKGVGASKAMTQATLNLSRQFADVGVTAAMGMSPLMILIQQGPQIADAFQTAKTQGLGFSATLRGMAVSMGLLKASIPPALAETLALATAQQTEAAAALDVAVANRAKMAGTAQAAEADGAAAIAANALAAANERVAVTAAEAAAAETVALAPLAVILGGLVATAGTIFVGAALAARSLNKDIGDLTTGLGLTAKQMEHLKDKGVNTGVTIGDVFKGTFHYIAGAVGDVLSPLGKWFSDLFDKITTGAVGAAKAIVGGFGYAFGAIKSIWSDLPAVIGDAAVSAANLALRAVETLINKALDAYNKVLPVIRALMIGTGNAVGASAMQAAGPVSLGSLANPNAGAAQRGLAKADAAGKAAAEAAVGALDGIAKDWSAAIRKAGQDRIKKAAGHGKDPRTPATPRDQTDERTAQIAAMLAQAMQDELQARLSITREAKDRAVIEKQIAAAALAEKQAQIDRQIANIADDKGLSAAKKVELTAQLEAIKAQQAHTASIRDQAIDEAKSAQLSKEILDRRTSALDSEIDLLGAQEDITKSAYARALIDVDILKAQQQIERLKLEEVIHSATSTATERAIAQARLNTLGKIHALELTEAKSHTRLIDAIDEAIDAVGGFKDAFRRHDWARAFDELQRTIETIQTSFASHGLTGGLLTAGGVAGSLIGGENGKCDRQRRWHRWPWCLCGRGVAKRNDGRGVRRCDRRRPRKLGPYRRQVSWTHRHHRRSSRNPQQSVQGEAD